MKSDDEDQSGERADTDPDPLLLGKAGSLQLIEILSQLMQILRGQMSETLIHLLLSESARGQNLRYLFVCHDVADQGQVCRARVETLIRRCLRRKRSGE